MHPCEAGHSVAATSALHRRSHVWQGMRVMADLNLVRSPFGRGRVERLAALVAIVVTLPLMALIALAIKCESAGPIITRSERFAEGGRRYVSLTFRTTSVFRPHSQGFFLQSAYHQRTWVGQLLWSIRMENLPQLFNVVRGQMSFFYSGPDRPFFLD